MMALMTGTTSWCNKMVIVGYIITGNSNKHQPFPLSFTVSSFSNQFKEMEKDVENKKKKRNHFITLQYLQQTYRRTGSVPYRSILHPIKLIKCSYNPI